MWVTDSGDDTLKRLDPEEANVTLAVPVGEDPQYFDGERILVTNQGDNQVSLWKATDLMPLGFIRTPVDPFGACSDGLNFWITLNQGKLARF